MKWTVFVSIFAVFLVVSCSGGSGSSVPETQDSTTGDRDVIDHDLADSKIDTDIIVDSKAQDQTMQDLSADEGTQWPDIPTDSGDIQNPDSDFKVHFISASTTINAFCKDDSNRIIAVGDHGFVALVRPPDFIPVGFVKDVRLNDCAIDKDSIVVVGDKGTAYMYSNNKWEDLKLGTDVNLYGVGIQDGRILVAGEKGTIMTYFPKKWKKIEAGVNYNLYGVWLTEASGPYIVGDNGMLVYDKGGKWLARQIAFPITKLYSILQEPSGLMVAVGSGGVITSSIKNEGWAVQATSEDVDPPRDLMDVDAFSDKNMYAVGKRAAIFHYDGHKWLQARIKGPYNVDVDLHAVVTWTDNKGVQNVWAFGRNGKGLILKDRDFVDARAGISSDFHTVWCDNGQIMIGGDNRMLLQGNDIDHIALSGLDIQEDVYGISKHYVVGKGGFVYNKDLHKVVDCYTDQDIMAVAEDNNIAVAVGKGGVALRIDSSGCKEITPISGIDLYGVTAMGNGSFIAVGEQGTVLLYDGSKWTDLPQKVTTSIRAVTKFGSKAVAVGDNGVILIINNKQVSLKQLNPDVFLYGVAANSKKVLMVGWAGDAFLYDGKNIKRLIPGIPVTFNGVCWNKDGFVIVGSQGTIARYVP